MTILDEKEHIILVHIILGAEHHPSFSIVKVESRTF